MLVRLGFTIRFIIFLSLFLSVALPSWSQGVPQNLNYQAVARDDNGYPIVDRNIVVEITIHADSETGEIVWQETHYKKTNEFGLFNLLIGSGVSTSSSTAVAKFSNINWAKRDYYIQTRVDFGAEQFGNGLLNMGTAKLSSVPYALLADSVMKLPPIKLSMGDLTDVDLTGLQKDKVLKWSGQKWTVGDAMTGSFITTDGKTDLTGDWMIAKNNVTLLAGTLTTNGLRTMNLQIGASPLVTQFSIDSTLGGISPNDAIIPSQKAVKSYVDHSMSGGNWTLSGNYLYNTTSFIGIGTKTPKERFHADIGLDGFLVTGECDRLAIPSRGAGTRMAFYPRKSAFMVGTITQANSTYWDNSNVGVYSNALGYDVQASGDYSLATGSNSMAGGSNAIAMGSGSSAQGNNSFAVGESNTAGGARSIAIGRNNQATGNNCIAMGDANTAAAQNSVSIGHNANTPSGADYAVALGESTRATGSFSFAACRGSKAGGASSAALGYYTSTSGMGSFAAGATSSALGKCAITLGHGLTSRSYSEVVVGCFNNSTVAAGSSTGWSVGDRVFVVGNGDSIKGTRSDAFVVMKNGNVGKSTSSQALDVVGSIVATGTITSSSDLRFKKNISTIDNALDKALTLRGVYYNWRVDEFKDRKFNEAKQVGFIAQEVEKIFPELVVTDADGYKSVDYARLTAVLIEALKEQQKIIAGLNQKVKDNDSKVDKLTEQFSVLNQRIETLEMLVKATASSK